MSETGNPFLGHHPAGPAASTRYLLHVLASTNPEHIVVASTNARVMNVYGYSDKNRTPNADDNTFIGWSADGAPPTALPARVYSGQAAIFKADPGYQKDMSHMWVQGTIGNGVLVEYDNEFEVY